MKQENFPIKIGILGAGQLARMLCLAAYEMGVTPYLFAENPDQCAVEVCTHVTYDTSSESLRDFINQVDLITIENEFVNLERLEKALGKKPLYPSIQNLRLVQNKFHQKQSLQKFKLPTLEFVNIGQPSDFAIVQKTFGKRFVVKKSTFGYDGRGTFIFNKDFDLDRFFAKHPEFNGYAEPLVDFKMELAVIVARSSLGEVKSYPVIQTHQAQGMCEWAIAPAAITRSQALKAQKIAETLMKKAEAVGVFGIEMFLLKDGDIVVNEIAPRVHNSGHLTMNAAICGQFEQHLRAILGRPLGTTKFVKKGGAMMNIIGRSKDSKSQLFSEFKGDCNTWVHWYGKSGFSFGRKLGHVNVVDDSPLKALKRAQKIRQGIGV